MNATIEATDLKLSKKDVISICNALSKKLVKYQNKINELRSKQAAGTRQDKTIEREISLYKKRLAKQDLLWNKVFALQT